MAKCTEQIYQGRAGYLRKIAVERRSNFLETRIFCKYPPWPWYICLITQNIHLYFDVYVYIRKEFHGHETPSFSFGSIFFLYINMGRNQTDRKSMREPNKIWHEGTHEGKKGKSKNANTPLQSVKMANFWTNSPWLLDNREICFTYTCNRPIKTKYFLYKVYLLILYYVIKFVSDLRQVLCDKVCQWFAADMWFSPGTLVSSHQTIDYKKKKITIYGIVKQSHGLGLAHTFCGIIH